MSHTVHIIPFHAKHLRAVKSLIDLSINCSFENYYLPQIIYFFRQYHSTKAIIQRAKAGKTYVAFIGEIMVGTGNYSAGYFNALYIHPLFQSKGIGNLLYEKLLHTARDRNIKTVLIDATINSKNFYIKKGFTLLEDAVDLVNPGNHELPYYKMKLDI